MQMVRMHACVQMRVLLRTRCCEWAKSINNPGACRRLATLQSHPRPGVRSNTAGCCHAAKTPTLTSTVRYMSVIIVTTTFKGTKLTFNNATFFSPGTYSISGLLPHTLCPR